MIIIKNMQTKYLTRKIYLNEVKKLVASKRRDWVVEVDADIIRIHMRSVVRYIPKGLNFTIPLTGFCGNGTALFIIG